MCHNTIHCERSLLQLLKVLIQWDMLRGKLSAVQVGESAGIGGEIEAQLVGIQRLLLIPAALALGVVGIFAVAQKGVPDVRKVGADLVGSAGEQINLEQRKVLLFAQHAVAR